MADTCKTCRYSKVATSDEKGLALVCKRNPPLVLGVPMQTPQGVVLMTQSAFPPVNEGEWCGEHEMTIKLVN